MTVHSEAADTTYLPRMSRRYRTGLPVIGAPTMPPPSATAGRR